MFICEVANNLNSANKSFIDYIKNNDIEFKALIENKELQTIKDMIQ